MEENIEKSIRDYVAQYNASENDIQYLLETWNERKDEFAEMEDFIFEEWLDQELENAPDYSGHSKLNPLLG